MDDPGMSGEFPGNLRILSDEWIGGRGGGGVGCLEFPGNPRIIL